MNEIRQKFQAYHLEDWKMFFDVMATGSIAQVAIRNGLERSQLSRRIAALEQEIGDKLLVRSGRKIAPTQVALEAKHRIQSIYEEMTKALDTIKQNTDGESGNIRFGGMPGYMQAEVVPALVEFQKNFPGIRFDVIADDDPMAFMNGETDIMLYYGPTHRPHLVEYLVTHSVFIACASPKYLENSVGIPNHPEDLVSHAGVVYTGRVRPRFNWLERGTQTCRFKFKSQIRFNNILSAKAAVLAGGGIALDLPIQHAYRELLSGNLVPVLGDWHIPRLENYIGATLEANNLKRVKIFIDWYIKWRRRVEGEAKYNLEQKFGLLF